MAQSVKWITLASFAQDQNIGMKRVTKFTQTGYFTIKWVLSSLIRQQERGWFGPGTSGKPRVDTNREEANNEEVNPFNSVNDVTWLQQHRREQLSFYLWSPVAQNNKLGQK